MRILLIDNYDSYTYNLSQLIATTFGVEPVVVRNDAVDWRTVNSSRFDAIVVSPGPGRPELAGDIGRAQEVIRASGLPVLGVCLGHQLLAWMSGADIQSAPRPAHGKIDRIRHTGRDLFAGLPQDFPAVRYHSLHVPMPLPDELEALAWSQDDLVMGFRHTQRPWWGVQFHPESIGTRHGAELLRNFAALAAEHRAQEQARIRPRHHLVMQRLEFAVDTDTAFTELFATSEFAFWLDSSRIIDGSSRFSFLGDAESDCGEVLRYRTGSARVEIRRRGEWTSEPTSDIFTTLRERLRCTTVRRPPGLPFDFSGGYVGYFGYELRAECGSEHTRTSPYPDAVWLLASRLVVVDHVAKQTWLIALEDKGETSGEAADWVHTTARVLIDLPEPATPEPAVVAGPEIDIRPWLARSRERYLADILACQQWLWRGESYEICLTNTLDVPFYGEPLALYRRLRRVNPAPYAAFLRLGDMAVLSSSPECFLKVDRAGVAESRPIKGTAARDADPARDTELRDKLREDPKTRAENLMIADLLRNDLGTVCQPGSVHVPRLMDVESYATMHQLVTTVRGQLRHDVSAVDAARACFPGGSMTGAPKHRTMRILDDLEHAPRGVYSGALGYFSLTGEADLAIVIRTAVATDNRLTIGAGAAIIVDSDPTAEYEEMTLKARTCLQALTNTGDPPTPDNLTTTTPAADTNLP